MKLIINYPYGVAKKSQNFKVIADLPPPIQGIAIVSRWVIQTLKDCGASVQIINTSAREGVLYPISRLLKFIFAFFDVLASRPKSTIYLALSHGPTLFAQIAIVLACRAMKHRVIVHHHTFLPINQPDMLQNYFCHKLLRKSVEHIFLSEYMRQEYLRVWNPKGDTWVISNHHAAHIRTIGQGNVPKIIGKGICYSGRLCSEKGFWDSAAVTRIILNTYTEMSVTFLGPTIENRISREIESLCKDFPERFSYVAEYDESTLSAALQYSTYYLFPSRYSNEASPLVVLEAQSLGNICLTSDVGSLRTDVLPPGVAVNIEEWQSRVLNMIEMSSINPSNLYHFSNEIRKTSTMLSIRSVEQVKAVFRV